MNSLRCISCQFLNFATASACKRCGQPLDSAAQPEWEPNAYAPSEDYQQQPTEGGSYFWDQPSYQSSYRPNFAPAPAPVSSGGPRILRILTIFAVLAGVSALALPKLLKKRHVDLSNVAWTDYRSPDGRISMSLPANPKKTDMAVPSPFGTAQGHMVQAEVNSSTGCMLMYADYPIKSLSISEETLYDMALKGATSQQNIFSLGERKYIMLDGHKGVEVELKPNDSKLEVKSTCRIFWVAPRMHVVLTVGPDVSEFQAVESRCLDSFHIK